MVCRPRGAKPQFERVVHHLSMTRYDTLKPVLNESLYRRIFNNNLLTLNACINTFVFIKVSSSNLQKWTAAQGLKKALFWAYLVADL